MQGMKVEAVGVQVGEVGEGVRKWRNRKGDREAMEALKAPIVICCGNKEDLKKTEDQLKNTDGLKFEPAASRDPRVVIRNVFSYNSEKDIVESLKVQNKRLWLDMDPSHFRVKEAYRKKARNPHQAHESTGLPSGAVLGSPLSRSLTSARRGGEPDVDYRCLEDMLPETVARLQLPAHLIYTDGSKSVDGVGAAYSYWRDGTEIRTKRMRLESMCTVFQAELLAIARATDLVVRGGFGCAAVLSDSRSSLDLIRNSETHHPLATHIRKNIRELEGRGKILQFFWVKAHVGIPGNERADELARLAAAQSRVAPAYDRCPVSYVKRRIREGAVHRWNERYTGGATAEATLGEDRLGTRDGALQPHRPSPALSGAALDRFDGAAPAAATAAPPLHGTVSSRTRSAPVKTTHFTGLHLGRVCDSLPEPPQRLAPCPGELKMAPAGCGGLGATFFFPFRFLGHHLWVGPLMGCGVGPLGSCRLGSRGGRGSPLDPLRLCALSLITPGAAREAGPEDHLRHAFRRRWCAAPHAVFSSACLEALRRAIGASAALPERIFFPHALRRLPFSVT
ncbi:hypothetical protein HW555_002697 [Spodoptera exigua]|uniref:RNase H type-1 domain-containing protein n=1 Tax=Spodoptera exigua TaxID=7107 RepID=A0A835LDZ3_SPOEX|nr:hypothetical protein HW555_002697 [Spodoptera exigua]